MDKNIYLIELAESKRTDFGRVDFEEQSEAQKVFSAIWELESEVNNGGFSLYFCNCDSDIIAFAQSALKAIGATACARIVESAINLISPFPATREERCDALAVLKEEQHAKLEFLDSKFFEYPDNLTELLFAYVTKHPESFGPVPT